jgi:hypothetical protein
MEEKVSGTYWIGSWVLTGACLDAEQERTFLVPTVGRILIIQL